MRQRKYPLEPLPRLKDERADAAARALGQAVHARDAASRQRQGAEEAREADRVRADRSRAAERGALERGELAAKDLHRGGSWEARVRSDDAARGREVERARAVESQAETVEAEARGRLAEARGEAEAVRRHRDRFVAGEARRVEAAEEEALAEAVRPRRRGRGLVR